MTPPNDSRPDAETLRIAPARASVDGAPPPAATALPRRRRRSFGWWRWIIGSSVVVWLPAALLVGLAWSLFTQVGAAWWLARQVVVEAEQWRGSLLGGFEAHRLIVHLPSGPNDRIVIDAPRASALRLGLSDNPRAWLRLRADSLSAERVSVQVAPSGKPPSLPAGLELPVEIEIGQAQLGRLELPGLDAWPLLALRGRVHLGAARGSEFRADAAELQFGPMQLRGAVRLGTGAGLPLQAQLEATQAPRGAAPAPAWAQALREDWRATLEADGPLARFKTVLTLRAQGQRVDASAEVAPLEPWPLPLLDARTERLDVSAFLADAPATALTGSVRITPIAQTPGSLSAWVQMNNERPGRWNERRLPLRRFGFELRARPGALTHIDVLSAQATLASESTEAGKVQGDGAWNAGEFRLDARLEKVQPAQVDARLPAMTVTGPIKLKGVLDKAVGASLPGLELLAELDGHLSADPSRAVRVRLAANSSANRIDVRELLAQAGAAQLSLTGNAARSAATAPWRINGQAGLANFDPLPWFPGEPGSAWRRGPHRFNAEATFGFDAPAFETRPSNAAEWLDWLPTLNGQARLTLRDSQLAGVPVRGEADWKSAPDTPAQLNARADAGGNSAALQGRWLRGGGDDTWSVDIKAPQLARLAPLLALGAVPAPWATPSGALNAQAALQGRGPNLRATGELSAQGLRLGEASVTRGEARWTWGGRAADAPFDLHADLGDVAWAQQRARSIRFDLKGTPAAHTLDLNAVLNAAPPAWAESLLAPRIGDAPERPQTGITLQASGAWSAASDVAASWRGKVQRLEVINGTGRAAPLAQLRDVGVEFLPGGAEQPAALTLQAGRGSVLGAGLRWERAHWQAERGAAAAQLNVEAELEPLAVAPLLARVQPGLGWQGDLRVGGRISVRSAPRVQADVVIERLGGDLSVTDESGTQALQLSDLRLALNANDGQWNFTQAFAGKTLGEAAGAVTARLPPDQWPNADTPIQGVLEARVANLGTWGAWVPPGWRLSGSMRTSASIGGRLGAPEYTGEMRGSAIGVRNIVQGVNVTNGEIAINLRGAQARIERFEAKAGDGTVRMEGGASLGETPRAELNLVADKFQLLGRVDRRIVTSGSARLQLDAASLKLDGKFSVDEGLIDFTRGDSPTLSDDVRVSGRPSGVDKPTAEKPADAPAAPRGSARNVNLDLQVGLGQNLKLRGRGLDTQLRGDLRLTTPANKLALNGTVRTATGTYAAYGQKLSIERGELTFTGAAENPRLDIIATRPNLEQTVGVAVTGTALNPRVRLFSEPEMADIDKLSWLVLGRASDGLGRTDTALLQRAALGLLAGEGAGPTDQLITAIGLDEVSFRQTEGEVRETVVSLGKQLSRRWYVGYERSLNATTGNWQLIYRIAQRLTLRAQSGLDNSLDAIWTWRWQ